MRSGAPATLALIGCNVITFLIGFATFNRAGGPFDMLVFTGQTWPTRFWTILTWPLVASPLDLLGLLFGGLWAFWIGGSLERAWGTRSYLTFLVATSALTALTLWLGGSILPGTRVVAQGLWLAIAAPTIAWCAINTREVIRLYGIIPIPAPILALLTLALTWFQISVSGGHPLLGLFSLSGCAAAFWYARYGRYASRGYAANPMSSRAKRSDTPLRFRDFDREPVQPSRGFSFARWMRERQERRRLEKLFRGSGIGDPDEKNRRQ